MGLFAANWKTQVEKIQAPVYRTGALLDFLRALGGQLQYSNDIFNTFDATVRKQSLWNGQKIVLQAALNDYFALAANTIRVNTNLTTALIFTYNEAESQTTFIFNEAEATKKYVYNEGEITNTVNFTVQIPIGIYTAEMIRRVSSITTLYKLAGVTFNTASY